MNDQFLQGVIFDWNRIDNDSYLMFGFVMAKKIRDKNL